MSQKSESNLVQLGSFLTNIEKLHVLGVVGSSGSLRDAATRLGIAPSTLSEKMSTLEALYGRSLLVRGRQKIALTPFAQELVDAAAGPISALEQLAPAASGKTAPRIVRLGAYDSLAVHVLPALLEGITEIPGIKRLDVRTGRSSSLMANLARGELDLVVAIGGDEPALVESYRVGTDELCFAWKGREAASAMKLLQDGQWIGLTSGKGPARFYRNFLAQAGVVGAPVLACDSFEVVRSLAFSTGLPALLPRRVAFRAPRPLAPLPLSDRARTAGKHDVVVARRSTFTNPIFEALLVRLRSVLREEHTRA